ncbi:MAG: 23S rRNA (guanosine(2251)-2'-O)-methyltransferase RlmB [Desulfobacterales bacterium]|nr:23S rRNA (guanosine(2251)-2'-O)-methyltransferase RlmB [Desulfobacterales bacterium]
MKAEILYGFHPVYEALRAGRRTFHEIYISKQTPTKRIKQITSAAARKHLQIKEISPARLQSLAGAVSPQGVAAKVTAYPLVDVADLLEAAESGNRPPLLLLLDHIVDPHNLGAIIRTAVCAGIDAVIIPKDRSAYPSPVVSKVSAGALEYMRVTQVNNIVRFVKTLKDQDFWIVGLDQNAGQSVYNADLTGAVGLVIGGEEKGIRTLVKQNCDFLVSIPQTAKVGSLNASVAGAIVMYESYRQRFVSKHA